MCVCAHVGVEKRLGTTALTFSLADDFSIILIVIFFISRCKCHCGYVTRFYEMLHRMMRQCIFHIVLYLFFSSVLLYVWVFDTCNVLEISLLNQLHILNCFKNLR